MKIIPMDSLRPPTGGAVRFEGGAEGVDASFFVVNAPKGRGAAKHRHPYPEVFVVLDGAIDATIDDETTRVTAGNLVIIPAGAWHAFAGASETPARMVDVHPVPEMIQENWADLRHDAS